VSKRHGHRLDDCDVEPEGVRRRSYLQSNEVISNDRYLRAGFELCADRHRVFKRPKNMHSWKIVRAEAAEPAIPWLSRAHQRKRSTVLKRNGVLPKI